MCVEIACDESGSEGGRLVGGTTDVLAHASVVVDPAVARGWLDVVRRRARSPADEVKASVVLRAQNRALLHDLLGRDGPFWSAGAPVAHVHLTEKRYLLVVRFLDLLGIEEMSAAEVHAGAPRAVGARGWAGLLDAFDSLLRSRVRAAVLDPLVPALAATITHWARPGRPVRVVHDEHRTLREGGSADAAALCPPGALAGLRFVDSRDDARVQLADFLAGAARRVASEVLAGRADAELLALVRPFVSPASTWGDPDSWSWLRPDRSTR